MAEAVGPGAVGQRHLSRKERLALYVHRGLDKHLSPIGVWVFRRTKGSVAKPWKVDALLLTTLGRRSGRHRTVVLQFFPDGESMVVAAANDGGQRDPAWYLNLKAEPMAVVEIKGKAVRVRAEELAGDEAATWWERIVGRDRNYERYARATSRPIPILRLVPSPLVPRGDAAAGPSQAPSRTPRRRRTPADRT